MRQPNMVDHNLLVRPQPLDQLPVLEVPEHQVPVRVSRRDVPPVGREPDLAGVTSGGVPREALLAVLLKSLSGVDEDLVVERLGGEPFLCGAKGGREPEGERKRREGGQGEGRTVGVKSNGRHGVHVGLSDVLDHDRDIVVPRSDRLVVRGRDEPAVVVDEGDRVDGSEMLVVLLRDLVGVGVVLQARVKKRRGESELHVERKSGDAASNLKPLRT